MHPVGLEIVKVVAGDEVEADEPISNVIGLNGFVAGKVTLKGFVHHTSLSTAYMVKRSCTVTVESTKRVFVKAVTPLKSLLIV